MIKAVSFDLWFTLIWENQEDEREYTKMRMEAIHNSLRELGFNISPDDIYSAYAETKDFRLFTKVDELMRIIILSLGLNPDEEIVRKVAEAYDTSTDSFKPRVNEEALDVIPELRKAGVKVAITTSTSFSGRAVRNLLKNAGIYDVDCVISSSDIGCVKPQKKVFASLVEELKVNGENIVHVGDSYIHDVVGAINSGLKAVYYPKLAELRGSKIARCKIAPVIWNLRDLLHLIE
ncbi:MAG: HAD family hydrolase [Candidatus Methanodesulfokora washburnensis]|jgi:HAD superfamily hydrolase (TIGR01549 family)